MMEIDHATKQVYSNIILSGTENTFQDSKRYEEAVSYRLSNPAMISYVNLEKIAFERFEVVQISFVFLKVWK